jgi:hypothetical protein
MSSKYRCAGSGACGARLWRWVPVRTRGETPAAALSRLVRGNKFAVATSRPARRKSTFERNHLARILPEVGQHLDAGLHRHLLGGSRPAVAHQRPAALCAGRQSGRALRAVLRQGFRRDVPQGGERAARARTGMVRQYTARGRLRQDPQHHRQGWSDAAHLPECDRRRYLYRAQSAGRGDIARPPFPDPARSRHRDPVRPGLRSSRVGASSMSPAGRAMREAG